jgi:hypothetical protein
MAFSAKKTSRSLAGSKVMEVWTWNAAAVTSGTIRTGLKNIEHVSLNNIVTEADGKAVPTKGDIAISGVTANDKGTVLVIGY